MQRRILVIIVASKSKNFLGGFWTFFDALTCFAGDFHGVTGWQAADCFSRSRDQGKRSCLIWKTSKKKAV